MTANLAVMNTEGSDFREISEGDSLDLAPRYAATVVGVQACVANLAGVIAPVAVGYIARSGGWDMAFLLTAVISGCGILAFLALGTSETVLP